MRVGTGGSGRLRRYRTELVFGHAADHYRPVREHDTAWQLPDRSHRDVWQHFACDKREPGGAVSKTRLQIQSRIGLTLEVGCCDHDLEFCMFDRCPLPSLPLSEAAAGLLVKL